MRELYSIDTECGRQAVHACEISAESRLQGVGLDANHVVDPLDLASTL